MASYKRRRKADIALRDGAKRIVKSSRAFSRKRWAARRTVWAFSHRIRTKRHGYPNKRTRFWTGNFRYGNYGGIGHGIPAGEWRQPIDDLDALYLEHDLVFAPADMVDKWKRNEPLRLSQSRL
jgi:hypothetical protein